MARTLMLIGGSGFFGKSFLDAHARGLLTPWDIGRIIAVARNASGLKTTHSKLLGDGVELLDADAATVDDLPQADIIVHAASSTDARRYGEDPLAERANILAALDNYAAIAASRHRRARIVYCSSGAVYGQQPAHLARLPEGFEPEPASGLVDYKRDYAEAKRLAEARMARLGDEGIPVAVARCFAFIGVHLPRDQHFAIGNFLADGLACRPITVNARRRVTRSWMHADDLVSWLLTIADASDTTCPIYNVGADEAFTVGEAALLIAARFGVEARIPPIDRPGEDRYVPSIERALAGLGLERPMSLSRAIDDVAGRLAA